MLFPVHKRSIETFENYFNEADLKPIVDFQVYPFLTFWLG